MKLNNWIAQQFKELLSDNFKTLKSPTEYAKALNYSLSHLNESVKNTTGFPVSYWIHQQVILEANIPAMSGMYSAVERQLHCRSEHIRICNPDIDS